MAIKFDSDRLTLHFRLSEFVNTLDGNRMYLDSGFIPFVLQLQEFRLWYGRPMNITSGYRTAAYNRKVGGASNSMHLKGLAVDFRLPAGELKKYGKARKEEFYNNIKDKWFLLCDGAGVKGSVVFYDAIIHLDYRRDFRYFDDRRGK